MRFKTAIERQGIIETGSFVWTRRAGSQLLFVLLTDLLFRVDREWLGFIANHEVESLLTGMNFTLIRLADVSENTLADKTEVWRSYYDRKSRVIFFHIPSAISVLQQSLLASSCLSLFSHQLEKLAEQWNARS